MVGRRRDLVWMVHNFSLKLTIVEDNDPVKMSVPIYNSHVAAKPSIPLRIGTNLKVDFFESLDPPR